MMKEAKGNTDDNLLNWAVSERIEHVLGGGS